MHGLSAKPPPRLVRSRPVEIGGRFVGVVLCDETAWRFRALDPGFAALDGIAFRDVAAAAAEARLLRFTSSPCPCRNAETTHAH